MNRRLFLQTTLLAFSGASALRALAASADTGRIGRFDPAEFTRINREGLAKMAAIKPDREPLSRADEKLFVEMALGGMMQLELSRVGVRMANSPDVRAIAQAEVEEQTAIASKLREVAAAKRTALPAEPDEKTQRLVTRLQGLSGDRFDRAYLKESGVAGHRALNATMERVESKATDQTLRTIAATALPLIRTHLQVAQEEMTDLT